MSLYIRKEGQRLSDSRPRFEGRRFLVSDDENKRILSISLSLKRFYL
jgi:hypothetical protein